MIFGIVLAGGVGARMHTMSSMPKQFMPLGDKPIVIHTLEKFVACDRFDALYVGTHPDWVDHMADLIDANVTSAVPVAPGISVSSQRSSSLM